MINNRSSIPNYHKKLFSKLSENVSPKSTRNSKGKNTRIQICHLSVKLEFSVRGSSTSFIFQIILGDISSAASFQFGHKTRDEHPVLRFNRNIPGQFRLKSSGFPDLTGKYRRGYSGFLWLPDSGYIRAQGGHPCIRLARMFHAQPP